ncbi:helix-turn-helix domain-containing protein [Luteibacter pinisoli]|uniref:Helix-turn-helix domain-containing protein n=2 Tax=Luteibacter pinisoli TaxID=2589080 RepID=A0A4Y5Z3G2_9GAMM|nr:helix-turn-helix domain-containing protein [Luteibacter pinisoli]
MCWRRPAAAWPSSRSWNRAGCAGCVSTCMKTRHATPRWPISRRRHPVHLARSFRLFHHCTPGDYLRRLRVERAAQLLRSTRRPLLEIALECGFAGAAQFSRSFRAVHAVTPTAWRRSR